MEDIERRSAGTPDRHPEQFEQSVGMAFPDGFVADLVDFCERRNLYLITDDIYHKLVFDGQRAAPAYNFTTQDVESSRIIVINGISKLYGMTGFRIGWAVGPRAIIEIMANVQAQTTLRSAVLQAGAEAR
jgi:aspartate aminotransferase